MALLLLFITTCTCEWPPPHNMINQYEQKHWEIDSMAYTFGFPLSCDVEVVQTIVMNYTHGNFTDGYLFIPQDDYDALKFERIESDNKSIPFTAFSDNSFHRIHYYFDQVTAPSTKTFTFKYTAIQATKTFSRSGSSKNSFSWPTITKQLGSKVGMFNVILNFYFHTQENSIDCNPDYSSITLGDTTTVVFATETDIPENSELTHQISFPKRITCKPASSYKLIAMAVVVGSILFAVVTTIVALVVRRMKLRGSEHFEQLSEVS